MAKIVLTNDDGTTEEFTKFVCFGKSKDGTTVTMAAECDARFLAGAGLKIEQEIIKTLLKGGN